LKKYQINACLTFEGHWMRLMHGRQVGRLLRRTILYIQLMWPWGFAAASRYNTSRWGRELMRGSEPPFTTSEPSTLGGWLYVIKLCYV
jgi:hypothetical protein